MITIEQISDLVGKNKNIKDSYLIRIGLIFEMTELIDLIFKIKKEYNYTPVLFFSEKTALQFELKNLYDHVDKEGLIKFLLYNNEALKNIKPIIEIDENGNMINHSLFRFLNKFGIKTRIGDIDDDDNYTILICNSENLELDNIIGYYRMMNC